MDTKNDGVLLDCQPKVRMPRKTMVGGEATSAGSVSQSARMFWTVPTWVTSMSSGLSLLEKLAHHCVQPNVQMRD